MIEPGEADGCARSIMMSAGFDPDEKCGARELAERTPGLSGVYTSRGLKLPGDVALFSMRGERYIALRSGVPLVRARWGVFHEIAEHDRRNEIREDIEQLCNAIAGALAMPRRAFVLAIREVGENPHALAERFTVTPTAAALRMGEVTHMPMAVMTPRWMWIRGREFFPSDERLIRREARSPRPGLRKILLEPRRQALVADGLE